MARTKEYDRTATLEAAMILFWSQGYTATSVQQLLTAMGLSRSSMYSDFGNKRDLFIEVLAHYCRYMGQLLDSIKTAKTPVDAVRELYRLGFEECPPEWLERGCLLSNTIVELQDVDNELSVIAAKYFYKLEETFANYFQTCLDDGRLKSSYDSKQLASFFITVIKGMRVVAREKPGEEYLRGIIEASLFILQ